MRDPLQPNRCAMLLGALAAPERLRIIRFLKDGAHNVTEIAAMLQAAPVNVSHHLSVLRRAKLVRSKKRGRFVLYSLAPNLIRPEDGRLELGCCRIELPWSAPLDNGKPVAVAAVIADDEDDGDD